MSWWVLINFYQQKIIDKNCNFQFSYAATSSALEYQKYCFMSVHKNMIINFLIPIFILIVATTILGTICLKHIKDKNRDILDSTSNVIASGIVMNNGGNIDRFLTDKEILACYYMKASACSNQLKCCDEHVSRLFKNGLLGFFSTPISFCHF